ncbi:MAG: undecaprenyl/decaprenyl-phosphate alpha-N-acetylglucosaminyl 1-phosphate transferase, partial [Fimbriimonadaceae bacterium]
AFFVVIRRLKSGTPIGQADNRHVHYTLLRKGLNQKQVVWSLYAVTAVLCSLLVIMVRAFS